MTKLLALALTLTGLSGAACSSRHAEATPPREERPSVALETPTTTSAQIALHNLDAEIVDRLRRPERLKARTELVDRYLARVQFLGSMQDLAKAEDASLALARSDPDDPGVHLARASVLGTLHEFRGAEEELDRAQALGAPASTEVAARASLLLARGLIDEADRLLPYSDDLGWEPLEMRASLEGYRGDPARSSRLFEFARQRHRDGSPFAVAWMDFERARSLERQEGHGREARAYLLEAVKVLPFYAHAVVHLAATEPPEQAEARLEGLDATCDDPEVLASRADALRRLGRREESSRMVTRARARFEELLARWPRAFADHAATFFLGVGGDLPRAVALARDNAENRPTEEAVELWLTAAQAAGVQDDECAAARQVATLEHAGRALEARARDVLAADVSRPCP